MSDANLWLKSQAKNWLPHAIGIVVISIIYGVVFLIPLPPQFKRQGIFLMDEFILLGLITSVYLSYRWESWIAKYLRLGLVLIAFTFPLLRLWETAESTWNIVLGLLPWADATEYYFDVNRLLEGGLFGSFSGRRPLFSSLLAVLLKLSNQNLQLTLIVFTIINALAVFLLLEEVRDELGSISAIVILYLSQLFYRPFVATTLTEQFGYPIGLLAVVVLIRGLKTSRLWLFALGVALLSYGLLIRAGAFFVLPILILFALMKFAENCQQYVKVLFVIVVAIVIPVLSNSWLGREVSSPEAVKFANFADTLYGQARGGVRWTQAAIDHPELASMTEPGRSRLLYHLAFEEIIKNPLGLIKGSIKALADFVRPGPLSAFGFLTWGNKRIDFLFQILAAFLFLFGLWRLWLSRKSTISGFALAYWTGTFFSIPFLPPIDAGIRPYAATIACIFLPICFVFSSSFFRRVGDSLHENRVVPIGIAFSLAFTLLLCSLIGAPLLRTAGKPVHIESTVCEPDLIPLNFKLTPGSYISLSSIETAQKTKVPNVLLTDVHRSFDDFPYGDFASVIRKIKQPALVAAVVDLSTEAGVWVVTPFELKNQENETISACAEVIFSNYSVLLVKTFEKP